MHSPFRTYAPKRTARRVGARILLTVPIALAALPAVAHAGTTRIDTDGCGNQFTVPAGVSSLEITAHGAAGGGSTGGQGAWIKGTVSVTAGTTLYACVNQDGGAGGVSGVGVNGYDGGGYALISKFSDLSSPYVIAGGGGGAGGANGLGVAGTGGRATHTSAGGVGGDSGGGTGGQPADGNGAGAKGTNADNAAANGFNGTIRKGGKGGAGQNGGSGAGGGGGGVWGGGGGGASNGAASGIHSSAAGGGGGSSYCDMSSCAYAYAGGTSYVDLTWVDPPQATTTSAVADSNPIGRNRSLGLTATVSPVPTGGTVAFEVDGNAILSCSARPVDTTTGKATCASAAPSTSGTHNVKASFSGVTGFYSSNGNADFTVTAPKATVAPAAFGNVVVGETATRVVTVANEGGEELRVDVDGTFLGSLAPLGGITPPPNTTDYKITTDTCTGVTVPAGATCAVTIAFKPSKTGKHNGQLTVLSDSETGFVTVTPLYGIGTLPAPPAPEPTPETPAPVAPVPTPTDTVTATPTEPAKGGPLKVAVSVPGAPKQSSKGNAALPVNPSKPLTIGCETTTALDSCDVKLTVTVRGKPVVIGKATSKPGSRSADIKLNATGRRLLANAPAGLTVRVAITGRSAEGVETATAATRLVAKRTVTLLDGFAVNSAELTAKGRRFVDDLAAELKGDAPKRIVVTGHTDSSGPASAAYREALGLDRAQAIAERLRERGVRTEFVTRSAADKDPVASNATAAGKAANRRVTLELTR